MRNKHLTILKTFGCQTGRNSKGFHVNSSFHVNRHGLADSDTLVISYQKAYLALSFDLEWGCYCSAAQVDNVWQHKYAQTRLREPQKALSFLTDFLPWKQII
jgi:hypothetical protein